MQFQENISLKSYNTFGIEAAARYFASFHSLEELQNLLTSSSSLRGTKQKPQTSNLVLGGGSNILFTKDFDGVVLKNEINGIEKISEDENFIYIKCGAGENWHQVVLHCIENNWGGLENLSLIPGCVGASPMQNIGAYGAEIKDVFHELTAFHLQEKGNYIFKLKDCEFGYRESVFKRKYKDQFVIADVTYRLSKKPKVNTSYGAIEQELEKMGVQEVNIKTVSQAVINIRSSKLPDPKEIGNAGSFFKNPSVAKEKFLALQSEFPLIVGYENADGSMKLAAGWLIEQCGWKGFRDGDAGVHAKQALVLVNYGNAKGSEIYALSEKIVDSVADKFGVALEREVNII
ncbi:UDP-N-acetylmuramate dehydrogenase [Terrimonas alba]|uniref:UDP-N-acetylmuramate dehydrogenase n=1 Tax=Terrimonas alba TaxID=3349636 RepID=UPI0035F4174B